MDIQQAHQQIDQITAEFRDTFGHLTEEELNWKPDSQAWSIAQNIDHLIVINESYFPAIRLMKKGQYQRPWLGRFSIATNLFGNLLMKSVQPDRKQKAKTFKIWEPATSHISGDMLERFASHQQTLKQTIEDCRLFINAGMVIASPASKMIVYKLSTAFEIMITHELRHFEQAKEVLAMIEKNAETTSTT